MFEGFPHRQARNLPCWAVQGGKPRRHADRCFRWTRYCVLAAAWTACHAIAESIAVETQIEPLSRENFAAGQFRLWLGDDASPVSNGVLAVVLGSGQNALHLAEDPTWRELATRMRCALLAGFFVDHPDSSRVWNRADLGSGRALLAGLSNLAAEAQAPHLAQAPLWLAGNSAGGQFAYHFAATYPELVRAFATLKGGMHHLPLAPNAAGVPGLLIASRDDSPQRLENMGALFKAGEALGAPWLYAVESGHGHSPERAAPLVGLFFETVLRGGLVREWRSGTNILSQALRAFEADGDDVLGPELSFQSGPAVAPPAVLAPGTVSLGRIDVRAGVAPPSVAATVEVRRIPGAVPFDRVYIPQPEGPVAVSATQAGPDVWTLKLELDPAGLDLGACRTDVPVRFALGDRPLLVAPSVPVSATLAGEVRASPPNVFLGALKAGVPWETTVTLRSRSGGPVSVLAVSNSAPGWTAVEVQEPAQDGTVPVRCVFRPARGGPTGSVAAVFRFQCRVGDGPIEPLLPVRCFGSVVE